MKIIPNFYRKVLNIISRINKYCGPLYKKFSKKIVLVLGDSHVKVFYHPLFLLNFPKIYFDVIAVPGATITGLNNPKSKTQAKNIFEKALKSNVYDEVLFCLGEVDTGYLIWYLAKKYNTSVDTIFNQAIERYCKLIADTNVFTSTIVLSAPLPTIEDDKNLGDVAALRKEVVVKQLDRTNLTLSFNPHSAPLSSGFWEYSVSLDDGEKAKI